MPSPEDREPFDETAVTRGHRRCYFCEAEKSDEWRFLKRLNAFICKTCLEKLEKAFPSEQQAGKKSTGDV